MFCLIPEKQAVSYLFVCTIKYCCWWTYKAFDNRKKKNGRSE